MSDSGGIPELQYNHPDGRQRTRLEMDQWLRQEIPKVHWLRIIASRVFSLPKQISWDMREIVLKHWLLDEMVRRQFITGDQLGINVQNSNDEGELRQFTQRLAYLVQSGQAVSPQHAEGVDMSQFQPPPPPMMGGAPVPPNGQPTAYPQPPQPPGPPGPPGGYAQPPMPPGPPQQGYAQPPMPPGPPGPPTAPPQGAYAPPLGVPAGPPMGPPPGPPQAAAPQPTGGRGGRRKAEAAPAAAPPGPPPGPPMAGPPGAPPGFAPAPAFPGGPQPPVAAPPQVGQPQGFAPLPNGAPVQQGLPFPSAPQQAAAPAQAAGVDPALGQKLDQVLTLLAQQAKEIAELKKQVTVLSVLNTVLGRGMYQKQGTADPAGFLTELGVPLPQ